jgi:hypothetical protein
MDETKSPEPAGSSAKPSYIRKIKVCGISKNHISNNAVTGKKDADLPSKFSGKRRQVFCQLR